MASDKRKSSLAHDESTSDALPSQLEGLLDAILSQKVSIEDLIAPVADGDYRAAVQQRRVLFLLSRDVRFLEHLLAFMAQKMREAGHDPESGEIEKELERKDGARRFPKLLEERTKIFGNQPRLLTGQGFNECLEQYLTLISHVEKLWLNACQLYCAGNHPMAAFVAILVIEEVGKLSDLGNELLAFNSPRESRPQAPIEQNHRRKHFVGVVSGALINARLDRVLGKDTVRKILHQAESGELEKLRQKCLYIDIYDDRIMTPEQVIDPEQSKVLIVLAGELMAEILGYFPWEFERMLGNVIEFERSLNLPEKKIRR